MYTHGMENNTSNQKPSHNHEKEKLHQEKDSRLLLELPDTALRSVVQRTSKNDTLNATKLLLGLSCVCQSFAKLNKPNTIKTILELDQRALDDNLHTHIFLKDDQELTPFFKLLITMGAQLNRYIHSLIPLICTTSNTYIINHFITTYNPDIDEQDETGNTPLRWAIDLNNADIVQMLLEQNADMYLADKIGRTPTDIALLYGRIECLKLLIKNGVDTDIEYDWGHDYTMTIAKWAHIAKNEEIYTLVTKEKIPKIWYEKSKNEMMNDTCVIS